VAKELNILLERIQYYHDQKAFRQLYQSYFHQLYQFAFSFVHSKENAEEIVNDVFLNLWQKSETLHSIQNINVYFYVAVRNASLNLLRRNHPHQSVCLDTVNVEGAHLFVNPESILISRELMLQIQEAVNTLPPRCRLIFKMIKEDKLSYKEVAAILEISVKTVDAQLCIALKKLSHLLQAVYASE